MRVVFILGILVCILSTCCAIKHRLVLRLAATLLTCTSAEADGEDNNNAPDDEEAPVAEEQAPHVPRGPHLDHQSRAGHKHKHKHYAGRQRLRTRVKPRQASSGCSGLAIEVQAKGSPVLVRSLLVAGGELSIHQCRHPLLRSSACAPHATRPPRVACR